MKIILSNNAEKFLDKRCNGDPKEIYKIRAFVADLSKSSKPALFKKQLKNGLEDFGGATAKKIPEVFKTVVKVPLELFP